MSDAAVGPLEAVYDAEISPLMVQIIAVCKRHNLPMLCTFSLDEDLACTSFIAPREEDVPEENREHYAKWEGATRRCLAEIKPAPAFVAFTMSTMSAPVRCPECGEGTAMNGACYRCHPIVTH